MTTSPDYLERYRRATEVYEASRVKMTAAADARALAVAEALADGHTLATLASELGLSRARLSKMGERGRLLRAG